MNKKKIISGTMAFTIVVGSIIPGTGVYAKTASEKEEVVYIMTEASGQVDSVNVVNIFGKGDITDYGNYSSVKMLTSTEPISQDGDTITFSSEADRIYYQGTLEDAKIPWNIDISYTLDGKKISPEDLAGRSGALEIRIKITENTACKNDYYDSYALQAAVTLDTDLCKNIKAEGATQANVGSDKQLSYTILPGKGLDATISADVTDFEMDAITINGIKLDLNLDIDDAELMDKVSEIMDASKRINDGSKAVNDGVLKLSDGGRDLSEGADSLYSATGSLDDGITSLQKGVTTLQSGLNTLNSKSADLKNGSTQVKDALLKIQSGLAGVSMSTDQLAKLTGSSSAIKEGIDNLHRGAVELQAGLSYQAYKAAMQQNSLNIDDLQKNNAATIEALKKQIDSTADENQKESLQQVVKLLQANNYAIDGTQGYFTQVSAGADSLVNGLAELNTNYQTFHAEIVKLAGSLSEMATNMATLKSGIDTLVTNYSSLDSGISEYTSGVATIVAGYSNLVNGTNSLASGSKELLEGTGNLKDATASLKDGIDVLSDGTNELHDGTDEFYNKTSDMDSQVEDSIDDMLASISGEETEVISFVSDKNTNVSSVQFVIKTAAIEISQDEAVIETETEKTSFWEKLKNLF